MNKPSEHIESKKYLYPYGNPEAKILIVSSHPSADDSISGKLFTGRDKQGRTTSGLTSANEELINSLDKAGIPIDVCAVASCCFYGIGSKKKPTTSDYNICQEELEKQINELKPELIIALGSEAWKRIYGKNWKTQDYQGEFVDCRFGCKLLLNHSPGAVVMEPTKRNQFVDIFCFAKDYITGSLIFKDYEYHVIDDIEVAKAVVQKYIDEEKFIVGYDAEWLGTHWLDDEVMYTFQFSCEEGVGFILDISKDGITENIELLETLKPLLEHPSAKRCGWNIRVDDIRLIKRGFKLADETLFLDGMKMMNFIDNRVGKGLENGITYFTKYPHYYVELNLKLKEHKLDHSEMSKLKFLEPDIFYRYCGGDAVSHLTACLNMWKVFPEKHKKYFQEVYMPFGAYLMDMEIYGLPVDMELMQILTDQYTAKFEELKESLNSKLKTRFDIDDFNPNSPPQKKNLVFELLKMEPAYYSKTGSGKAPKPKSWYLKQKATTKKLYTPSTNSKSISTMVFELKDKLQKGEEGIQEDLDIMQNLLDLGRVSVFANKFFSKKGITSDDDTDDLIESDDSDDETPLKQSYWGAVRSDNRIHSSFFECLKNFRTSSRPNIQVAASKVLAHIPDIFVPGYSSLSKEMRKERSIDIPKNIRNIFYSGDPNYLYACADVGGADLGIMAFLSGDPKFIAEIHKGSFHLGRAQAYFQNPNITKDDVNLYTIAKTINFSCSYVAELSAAAEPIQAAIMAESGLYVDINTINYALGTWKEFDVYMNWREECKQQVQDTNSITNARGMTLKFDSTDDFSIKAGYLNESLAFPVASELALFLSECCINIKKQFIKDNVWNRLVYPINVIHDDIQFIFEKSLLESNYFPEVIKYYMTDYTKVVTSRGLENLGMEINIAKSWKGEKIVSKETHWDAESKSWEW